DVRDHHREERVARDVEGHAEEDVGAALVELAAELPARDVELEERVAGRERDLAGLLGMPPAHDEPAALGVAADLLHHPGELIEAVLLVGAVGALRRAEVPPLVAIDGAELALGAAEAGRLLGRGPLVPDRDAGLLERPDVRLAADEPEELVDDRLEVDALGGKQREARAEIEAHLVAEDAPRAGAGAIASVDAFFEDPREEREIGLHGA